MERTRSTVGCIFLACWTSTHVSTNIRVAFFPHAAHAHTCNADKRRVVFCPFDANTLASASLDTSGVAVWSVDGTLLRMIQHPTACRCRKNVDVWNVWQACAV